MLLYFLFAPAIKCWIPKSPRLYILKNPQVNLKEKLLPLLTEVLTNFCKPLTTSKVVKTKRRWSSLLLLPHSHLEHHGQSLAWHHGSCINFVNYKKWATSLVAHMVNNLPAMQETWVWYLGQEDPLEKEMATHSSTLGWKIPWMEKPGGLQSMGLQRIGHDWATSLSRLLDY